MNSTSSSISVSLIIDSYLMHVCSVILVIFEIMGHSFTYYILTRRKFLKESIFRYFLASEIVSSFTIFMLGIFNSSKTSIAAVVKFLHIYFTHFMIFIYGLAY